MADPRRPLTPDVERRVAEATQAHVLAALGRALPLGLNALVFQGGTSLALAWSSPRFSEDLDFLLARERAQGVERAMEKVGKDVEQRLQRDWPGAKVTVRPRVKDDNPNALFRIGVELPRVLGVILVKAEFWRVGEQDLAPYLKTNAPLTTQQAGPATIAGVARPEQLAVDKLVAVAHRERLKWRDLFDLWFLHGRRPEVVDFLADGAALVQALNATGQIYGKTLEETKSGLEAFLATPVEALLREAERGLKPWLDEQMWQQVWPDTVREMARTAQSAARTACAALHEALPVGAPRTTKVRP